MAWMKILENFTDPCGFISKEHGVWMYVEYDLEYSKRKFSRTEYKRDYEDGSIKTDQYDNKIEIEVPYFLWYADSLPNSELGDEWIISSTLGLSIADKKGKTISNGVSFNQNNGKTMFGPGVDLGYLWYSNYIGAWIDSVNLALIAEVEIDGEYYGDRWFSRKCGEDGWEGVYEGRGSTTGTKNLFWGLDRAYRKSDKYDGDDFAGVYYPILRHVKEISCDPFTVEEGIGGDTDDFDLWSGTADGDEEVPELFWDRDVVTVGFPQWKDQNEERYRRRLLKDHNDNLVYGRICKINNEWIKGWPGSSAGWYKGEEPDLDNSITFTAMKMEDGDQVEDEDTEDLEIEFDKFVPGNQGVDLFVTEAPILK